MSDYDSDDAPEAINFAASKELVLKEVKAAAEAVQNQKQKKKDARKQREEITKQQKADKQARLEELKNSAPSDDIFDQLPEKFERKPKPRSSKMPTLTQYTEDENVSNDEFEQINDDTYISLEPSMKKRKVKRVKLREEEHGSIKFKICHPKINPKVVIFPKVY